MTSPDYITLQEIRVRAYELWERAGRPEDSAIDHWLAAELELQRERDALDGEFAVTTRV